MDDRPTRRTYARIERERRFLLERLPAGIDASDFERIHDVFIEGTHLRLRTVRATCRRDCGESHDRELPDVHAARYAAPRRSFGEPGALRRAGHAAPSCAQRA
jgi:hypothetical protein